MNPEPDPFDDELRMLLKQSRDENIPDFEVMWKNATGRAERSRLRKKTFYRLAIGISTIVATLFLIATLIPHRTAKPREIHHFCAVEAVEDWLLMMNSGYHREYPSDTLFYPVTTTNSH